MMNTNKCSNTMKAAVLTLLLVALPTLARPSSVYLDYTGYDSTVSQRGNPGQSVSGSYSWTSPEGIDFFVRYVADEFGYRVVESNALQRSAHGQLADGNQAYTSADTDSEEVEDVQTPRELLRAADVSDEKDSQEDVSFEAQNARFSVSSRGRSYEGRGLIPSLSQPISEQAPSDTTATVEAAPQSEVRTVEVEPIVSQPQMEQVSEMNDVIRTVTEMEKLDAQEVVQQEQELSSQTSPTEEVTEIISGGGRPLEDTEEETIVISPEPEPAVTIASDRQAEEAAMEDQTQTETEETPTQTEEPADIQASV